MDARVDASVEPARVVALVALGITLRLTVCTFCDFFAFFFVGMILTFYKCCLAGVPACCLAGVPACCLAGVPAG
jgi:hypothetical protein